MECANRLFQLIHRVGAQGVVGRIGRKLLHRAVKGGEGLADAGGGVVERIFHIARPMQLRIRKTERGPGEADGLVQQGVGGAVDALGFRSAEVRPLKIEGGGRRRCRGFADRGGAARIILRTGVGDVLRNGRKLRLVGTQPGRTDGEDIRGAHDASPLWAMIDMACAAALADVGAAGCGRVWPNWRISMSAMPMLPLRDISSAVRASAIS